MKFSGNRLLFMIIEASRSLGSIVFYVNLNHIYMVILPVIINFYQLLHRMQFGAV